ncbi:MAG: PAS domain-containing sensor histidine kinase [Ignavibacteriae bacterium]|nr:PAS domain-containing sensor histidine kinase [Ignavibacteriota bacterium]
MDLLPEIIYELDIRGKLTLVNKAGLDILGYTREEFEKGLFVHDIIVPEEKDYLKSNVKKIIDTGKSFKFEYHARKKNGTAFPVLVNSSPIFKKNIFAGTRGIVLDLTERKLIERKFKDSHDFLNTTINAMQEPFFVKDENHKWVILNDASIKMWGYSREALIGKSDYDIFPKEQADVFWEKDDFVFKNGSNTNIEEITDSKGEVRTIVTAKVLYTDEITGKKFIVGTIHDITDLRKAELKLTEYSKELEELNKNKDKFFSIIAHDLRNPFTSIYGFSSVLSEEFDTLSKEEIREYINYIYIGTKNIYDLIENLLTWSRLQTGRAMVQPVKLNLFSEVQDAINILNVFTKNKRIKLVNAVEKNISALGDDNMVDSILQNLISNAIKFTKASGLVKITSKVTDNFVEISIIDNGIGMSRDEIENLFQLGKQKSKTGTSEERGTGLGLILCKEMIIRLNGQLNVESEVNVGSTFSFTLPKT